MPWGIQGQAHFEYDLLQAGRRDGAEEQVAKTLHSPRKYSGFPSKSGTALSGCALPSQSAELMLDGRN
jgi:hypothetical protein